MMIAWPKSLRRGRAAPSHVMLPRTWSDLPEITDWAPGRGDWHPDAPPRSPIVASRDLPSFESDNQPMTVDDGARPVIVSRPVRDLIDEVRARPLPRSPEPLSEIGLDAVRALLADRRADTGTGILDLALEGTLVPDDLPLSALLDRFEQQIDRRIAMGEPDAGIGLQPEVDAALRSALETLKALSVNRSTGRQITPFGANGS
jgi:hypothetical protein